METEVMGSVIRRMRKGSSLTLRQMSEATGLSQSFLSQFERGHTQASISSLRVITEVLGMNLYEAFGVADKGNYAAVVRLSERNQMPFGHQAVKAIVSSRGLGRFEIFEVAFEAAGSTGNTQYLHGQQEECILVLEGTVTVELGKESHLLLLGDSVSFHSDTPHRVVNNTDGPARVLWVVSPPNAQGEDCNPEIV